MDSCCPVFGLVAIHERSEASSSISDIQSSGDGEVH